MPKVKSKRTKKPAVKKNKIRKLKKEQGLESFYYREITFTCPVRGLVTQKVKVRRYKAIMKPMDTAPVKLSDTEQEIEDIDSGMYIYEPELDQ